MLDCAITYILLIYFCVWLKPECICFLLGSWIAVRTGRQDMTKLTAALWNCVGTPKKRLLVVVNPISFVGKLGFEFLCTVKTDKIGQQGARYLTLVNKRRDILHWSTKVLSHEENCLFLMYFWTLNSNMFSEFLYHPQLSRCIRLCESSNLRMWVPGGL